MVRWYPFNPERVWFEFNEEKLAAHGVSVAEAREVFDERFSVRRKKRDSDGYVIVGQTCAGRRLKLIVQSKPNRIMRIITAWPL